MALIKQTELENGLSGSYWKIIGERSDTSQAFGFVEYGLLKDSDFRKNLGNSIPNEKYISIKRISIEGDEFWTAFERIKSELAFTVYYDLLKSKDENLSDAQDG